MLDLHLRFEDGSERWFSAPLPISVGRAAESDLRLKAWRVARQHARLERRAAGIFIDDLGALSGTFVNGRRITQYGPISSTDEIVIGPCLIQLCIDPGAVPALPLAAPAAPVVHAIVHAMPDTACVHDAGCSPISTHQATALGASLLPVESSSEAPTLTGISTASQTKPQLQIGDDEEYRRGADVRRRRRLHKALLEELDLRRRDITAMSDAALRSEANEVLAEIIARDTDIPADMDRSKLLREVVDEAVGLGPLEPLLADTAISEIMVNRHDEIFVESGGRLHRHEVSFSSEQAVLGVIERIVSPLGRRVDESSPMVDARLPDGSRVNVIIPPIALRGASITIRKFPLRRPQMSDLLHVGALDRHMSGFLSACVIQRKNMVVSGGTGSGKTTLLNVLSNCIPSGERVVTIEDAAELQLGHKHLVTLEARPANLEGRGAVTIRDLVRNALRMRPDRIVVGECRGAEAFDMLAAMNTGHEGSLTTLHANSPRDALGRLETMILMAGMDLPLAAVREHVASSIDIIVQQARLSSGRRVVTSVVQVTGQESGRVQLQELFRYCAGPVNGFQGCGIAPEGFELGPPADLTIESFNQYTETGPASAHPLWPN